MIKSIITFSLIIAALINGCQHKPDNFDQVVSKDDLTAIQAVPTFTKQEGESLLTTHCYSCHNPASPSHDEMLAPPLAGIKYKYKQIYPDRSTFIHRMTEFIDEPSKENAVMKGPVKQFGLMPKHATLRKDEIRALTAFIYDNQLPIPDWFPKHFERKHGEKWSE